MGVDLSKSHPDMDIRQYERTYHGFVKLMAYSGAATVIVLIALAIFVV